MTTLRDISAPDNPTHHSAVERRNRVMGKFIDVGMSKGDIKAAEDLDMYCAVATTACSLEYVYHGHTVMKYLTGEVPHRDFTSRASVHCYTYTHKSTYTAPTHQDAGKSRLLSFTDLLVPDLECQLITGLPILYTTQSEEATGISLLEYCPLTH